jgi:RecA/RadA recombinase
VYTNQVQAQPDSFLGNGFNSMRAAGGNIMGHASTYRIFLRKAGHNSELLILNPIETIYLTNVCNDEWL